MARGDFEPQGRVIVQGAVESPDTNIFDHLRVILKYRRMTVVVCGLAVITTGVTCLLWPARYLATASIVPPLEMLQGDPGFGMGLLGGGEAALLRQVMDVTGVVDTYVGILDSRAIAESIIDRFDLTSVYRTRNSRYKARKKLRARTDIGVSNEGIIYVAVEDDDPKRAAAIANAYVEELDKQNKRLSTGQATSKRLFLETRLREIEQKLSGIEHIPTREAQVQEILYEWLMRELEIARIEEVKSLPTIQVLDSATPPERHKPRRTILKTLIAGVVALVCSIFVAFGREYYAECRRRELELGSSDRGRRASRGELVDEEINTGATSILTGQHCVDESGSEVVEAARER